MAEKSSKAGTGKKPYKKPTADHIPDNDLNGVTGGDGEAPGQGIQCRIPGAVVINACRPSGLAALHKCQAGGAATKSCTTGGAALGCLPAGGAASGCTVGGTEKDD